MKTTNSIICKDRGKVKGIERTQTKKKTSFYSKNVNPEQRIVKEKKQKKHKAGWGFVGGVSSQKV